MIPWPPIAPQRFRATPLDEIDIAGGKTWPVSSLPAALPLYSRGRTRRDAMPSFTTMFRAIVMVAVGAAAFKGWQLYGPSNEKVKAFVVRASEMAQSAWKDYQGKGKDAAHATRQPVHARMAKDRQQEQQRQKVGEGGKRRPP